jgi:hypothetical protein
MSFSTDVHEAKSNAGLHTRGGDNARETIDIPAREYAFDASFACIHALKCIAAPELTDAAIHLRDLTRAYGDFVVFFAVFFVVFLVVFLVLLVVAFATFLASVPSEMSSRLPLALAMYAGTPSLN